MKRITVVVIVALVLAATSAQAFEATVSWQPPQQGTGGPVEGYVILYREAGQQSWQWSAKIGNVLTYKLDRLEWGKTYEVIVRAWNSAGMSPDSNVASHTVQSGLPPEKTQLPPVPGVPIQITIAI